MSVILYIIILIITNEVLDINDIDTVTDAFLTRFSLIEPGRGKINATFPEEKRSGLSTVYINKVSA